MKKTTAILGIFLLLGFSQKELSAQQIEPVEKDSISVGELVNLVEARSDYKVYTDLELALKVQADRKEQSAVQLLKDAFTGTEYMVSVYGNKIFILAGELLDTRYPEVPEDIRTKKVLTEETEKQLVAAIEECKKK